MGHAALSLMLAAPEFNIDRDEATLLKENLAKMSDAYGWNVGGMLSPKTAALISMATAAGMIYGPKVKAYTTRLKAERRPKPGPHVNGAARPNSAGLRIEEAPGQNANQAPN